jgi:hypothetical protein
LMKVLKNLLQIIGMLIYLSFVSALRSMLNRIRLFTLQLLILANFL